MGGGGRRAQPSVRTYLRGRRHRILRRLRYSHIHLLLLRCVKLNKLSALYKISILIPAIRLCAYVSSSALHV